MRFVAAAIDYDGTLAKEGQVDPLTVSALRQVIASGRKLILVTGRLLREVLHIFPESDLFTRIVAENGAVLYNPATREQRLIGEPPPPPLVQALTQHGIRPLDVGESIIATVRPHEVTVLEAIRDLGLEHHVIFNRESVMILPPGINKASGLEAALQELKLSPHNVVGIGDSENDHALFQASEVSVAVGSAVPMLKKAADLTTKEENGLGTSQLLAELVADDLESSTRKIDRHHIPLGWTANGKPSTLSPGGDNLLIAGSSGSGKSTLAHGIVERLIDRKYQVCIVDPEGDYETFENSIVFGGSQRSPTVAEVITALENPDAQVVVNLVGLPLADRPSFFQELLPRLLELRAKTGRPHRILIDETHHLLPFHWKHADASSMTNRSGMIFITVHPEQVSQLVLKTVDIAMTLGADAFTTLRSYAEHAGFTHPTALSDLVEIGEALMWRTKMDQRAMKLRIAPSKAERHRHRRKYAEGELPPERSFYFRGPEGQLNLRAQNLLIFRQMAEGIDDATWLHHLRQGDYSRWMETAIKDPSLAGLVREVEAEPSLSAHASRERVAQAIEERYTLPVMRQS